MDEVAQAAGVGKGTLYRRFVDRSSLCHALLDDNERRLQERVLRGFDLSASTPAVEQLMVLLDALLTFVIENAALLAEAEAFERGRTTRYESAVYVWRRFAMARSFGRAIARAPSTYQTPTSPRTSCSPG